MALRFLDSFKWLNPGLFNISLGVALRKKYSLANTPSSLNRIVVDGDRHFLQLANTASHFFETENLVPVDPTNDTVIIGMSLRTPATFIDNSRFLTVLNESGTGFGIFLRCSTAGALTLANAGDILAQDFFTLPASTEIYIEFKFHLNTAGSFQMNINGSEVFNTADTGPIDLEHTVGQSGPGWQRIRIRSMGSGVQHSDLYIADGTGNRNIDFLGVTQVQMVLPTASGSTNNWTASDGSLVDHHLLVDDTDDNDATYLEGAGINEEETFQFSDITAGPGFATGVIVSASMRANTDAGDVSATVNDGTTDSTFRLGSVTDTDNYTQFSVVLEDNPLSNLTWSETSFNGMQFGVKID